MDNIVKAKGLDKAKDLVHDIIMPTPVAVLNAATLLGNGAPGEPGLGEIIVVDVGGATTDVYSVAQGAPRRGAAFIRGLPEPFAKRTVEGDLGVRHNIETLVEVCRNKGVPIDEEITALFHAQASRLPMNEREIAVDTTLARMAVHTSFERHVGKLEIVYGSHGETLIQTGKDLSGVTTIIGTGGPITFSPCPDLILKEILATEESKNLLKPEAGDFYLDENYILYATGLLAQSEPRKALRIVKKYLKAVSRH